jgi:hypothetical protein
MTRLSLLAAAVPTGAILSVTGIATAADDATFVGLGGKQGIKHIVKDLIPAHGFFEPPK